MYRDIVAPPHTNPSGFTLVARPDSDPGDWEVVLEVLSSCCLGPFTYMNQRSTCACGLSVVENPERWAGEVGVRDPDSQVWGRWLKFWFGFDDATVELSYE